MNPESRRVLLVTGCSSGIGLDACRHMSALGWRVFGAVRRLEDEARVRAAGAEPVIFDYDDRASITALVEYVSSATGGRIDALFNNGAYGQPGAVEDLTTEVLEAQFRTNFFGWHELTRQVLPLMRARGAGRIIQCSSFLGFAPMKWRGAYNAAKFAVEGLASTLRLELRGSGIEVSIIRPGPIATNFVPKSMEMFHRNIDIEGSVHAATYRRRLENLRKGGANTFKLPPSAVSSRLEHALTAPRPKLYYHVTLPTHLFAVLTRLLPARWMDGVMAWISREN